VVLAARKVCETHAQEVYDARLQETADEKASIRSAAQGRH